MADRKMKKAPLCEAFFLIWRETGIRLHPAGRGLACEPNPSNPRRAQRSLLSRIKNAPLCEAFFSFWRRDGDSNPG